MQKNVSYTKFLKTGHWLNKLGHIYVTEYYIKIMAQSIFTAKERFAWHPRWKKI